MCALWYGIWLLLIFNFFVIVCFILVQISMLAIESKFNCYIFYLIKVVLTLMLLYSYVQQKLSFVKLVTG